MTSPPLDRRTVLGLAAALAASGAKAQTSPAIVPGSAVPPDPSETLRLWPGEAPGMNAHVTVTEQVHERSKLAAYHDRYVTGIRDPSMTVFRPDKPDGSAVLLTPGGGYNWVVLDNEGYDIARRLNGAGVTCFVLRYRLPGQGWSGGPDTVLQDAQRALRLIRLNAKDYGIDPARIGVMGFSAGGHLAALLATAWQRNVYVSVDGADSISARPDFAMMVYPVITMFAPLAHAGSARNLLGDNPSAARLAAYSPERNVNAATPPCFITNCADDATVPPQNSAIFAEALRAQKIPAEQHMFEIGGHGHGIRKTAGKPVSIWPELALNWGASHGFFPGHGVQV